jgi:methyl-accepting chemotaxis protein
MSRLANLKVRNKLTLLLVLPCAFLLLLAGLSVHTTWNWMRELRRMEMVVSLSEDLIVINKRLQDAAVAAIQYLQAQGKEGGGGLNAARQRLDAAFFAFKERVGELEGEEDVQMAAQRLMDAYADMPEIRRQVDAQAVSPWKVAQESASLRRKVLLTMGPIMSAQAVAQVAPGLIALVAVTEIIDAAVQEKELLILAMNQQKLSREELMSMAEYIGMQEGYLRSFYRRATPEQIRWYEEASQSPVMREVANFRKALLQEEAESGRIVDAAAWNAAQEARIEIFEALQDKILGSIRESLSHLTRLALPKIVILLATVVLVLGVTLILSLKIIKDIVEPLYTSLAVARQIASGNLKVGQLTNGRTDEIGLLQEEFHKMIANLQGLLGSVKENVDVLMSSSHVIESSLSQVSAGSQQMATAVSQTTSTMDQLRQTSGDSAQKAKDVLASADLANTTLQKSEEVLAATLDDMHRINEKMVLIAQNSAQLTEKGHDIGAITDSVKDLADQSHLLAVNAAIEAVKAGEQGKGFQVVAQEIRSLAEQSKQATVQVHNILGQVEQATSASAKSTEEGVRTVAQGMERSAEIKQALHLLSEAANGVSQAARQIAVACQQQLVGVKQVTDAMGSIKEATRLHVGQMHQIQGGVRDMNKVVNLLKEGVGKYQV